MDKMPENPFESLQNCIAFHSRDWARDKRDAWVYGVIVGWDDASLKELAFKHCWYDETVARLKRLHERYMQIYMLTEENDTLRSKLRDLHKCWIWQEPDGSNFVESMSGKLDVLIPAKRLQEIFTEFAALKEAQRWIPTSERFPTIADADVFQDVEVMSANGRMNVWYYNYVNADNPEITHWRRTSMPLPAAPEQEDADL